MLKRTHVGQIETLQEVLASGLITDWRCAVDGGAYTGEWAAVMAGRFETVHAFEPYPISCAKLHARKLQNVMVHEAALLDRAARVDIRRPPKRSTAESRFVVPSDEGVAQAVALDDLNLPACGLLKLDVEGAEHFALLGARRTIERCQPVLIVEINKRAKCNYGLSGTEVMQFIESIGYTLALERVPDMVFRPKCSQ